MVSDSGLLTTIKRRRTVREEESPEEENRRHLNIGGGTSEVCRRSSDIPGHGGEDPCRKAVSLFADALEQGGILDVPQPSLAFGGGSSSQNTPGWRHAAGPTEGPYLSNQLPVVGLARQKPWFMKRWPVHNMSTQADCIMAQDCMDDLRTPCKHTLVTDSFAPISMIWSKAVGSKPSPQTSSAAWGSQEDNRDGAGLGISRQRFPPVWSCPLVVTGENHTLARGSLRVSSAMLPPPRWLLCDLQYGHQQTDPLKRSHNDAKMGVRIGCKAFPGASRGSGDLQKKALPWALGKSLSDSVSFKDPAVLLERQKQQEEPYRDDDDDDGKAELRSFQISPQDSPRPSSLPRKRGGGAARLPRESRSEAGEGAFTQRPASSGPRRPRRRRPASPPPGGERWARESSQQPRPSRGGGRGRGERRRPAALEGSRREGAVRAAPAAARCPRLPPGAGRGRGGAGGARARTGRLRVKAPFILARRGAAGRPAGQRGSGQAAAAAGRPGSEAARRGAAGRPARGGAGRAGSGALLAAGSAPPPPPPLQLFFYGQGRPPPEPRPEGAGASTAAARHGASGAPPARAGYGELNGSIGEQEPFLKPPSAGDLPCPLSAVPNGGQPCREPGLALKQTIKGGLFVKAGLKAKSLSLKSGPERKSERYYESKARGSPSWDKAETHPVPNGIIVVTGGSPECVANGCVSRGADNDGSGSESGYATPKKRKGRCNSGKGCENLSLAREKTVPCGPPAPALVAPALKLEPEAFKPDGGDPKAGPCLDGLKPAWKCEAGGLGAGRGKPGVGDVLRKISDAKVGVAGRKFEERPKGKHVLVSSKEDSWTLFKPPPVFPVDNSSAKIVPKISYASKVKENLNKAVQNSAPSLSSSSSSSSSSSLCSSSAVEVQASSRLSQVPMSAMKSVTSANFSNGPVLAGADRGVCPAGVQSLLVPAASTVLSASSKSVSQDTGPSVAAVDQQKSSLFIYPSNMHGLFNVAAQAESPFLATQQNLGDIFQNQWGLSFINEPSAGPETTTRKPADNKPAEVTFQGPCPGMSVSQGAETPSPGPGQPAFPKAYELAKRTSPQLLSGLLKLGTAGEESDLLLEPHPPGDLHQAELSGPGACVFLAKDYNVDSRLSSPTDTLLVSTKEQRSPCGLERKESWGEFDLRAAVLYHVQEMESICNLQKRDPKRIITYAEGLDGPST
ncbi:FMR1-interacting protein NUFIP2 [Candoia aspera]|uniref:FMR1-interacting protein NUFIP2 n=1 Tax=Candoia aspera TaxID=51853 RepID=UPI002FD7E664